MVETINTIRLQNRIKEKGYKKDYVAIKIGVSRASLLNKISGRTEFTLKEARKLALLLGVEDMDLYDFFYGS